MGEETINIGQLSRSFNNKTVLNNLSISVPKGAVFGLVGENGAGKSTLIKHILGLWQAQAGSVRVFGKDPVTEPVAVLKRIGYLSEEPDLPGWMTISELMGYTEAFYPKWDADYAEDLLTQFALDKKARIKTLSKGQLAKAGLLIAQAHRPDLLLLDEPSSGLDPIVRADILAQVIRTVSDEGRTVFFSSHFLDEIERVSDHIAFLHEGNLVLCGPLEEIKEQHRSLTVRFPEEPSVNPGINGIFSIKGIGRERTLVCNLAQTSLEQLSADIGGKITENTQASLDEIFFLHAATNLRTRNVHQEAYA